MDKVFLLFIVISTLVNAQTNDTRYFEQLSIKDGLPHPNVHTILQDKMGFMWFGTEDGLVKYDGMTMTNYLFDRENPNSLSNNTIAFIYEDRAGYLWIATLTGGLNKFNPSTETFTRYQHDANNPNSISNNNFIRGNNIILEDSFGILWIGTDGGGLNKFDPNTGIFTHYRHNANDPNSLSNDYILAIFSTFLADGTEVLWIGTNGGGLNKFIPATETFVHYQHKKDKENSLNHNIVSEIYATSQQQLIDKPFILWLGTNHGMDKFDLDSETFTHYHHDINDPNSLSHNEIAFIHPAGIDKQEVNFLWIGTKGGGLNYFNIENKTFVRYKADEKNPHSLSNNTLFSIYRESNGALWIGTYGNGVSRFDTKRYKFQLIQHGLSHPAVTGIIQEESSGIMWIATLGGGLNKFDPATGTFTYYQHDPDNSNSLSNDNTFVIHQDKNGMIWIGTFGGGLNKFDPIHEIFTHYKHEPNDTSSLLYNEIVNIFEDTTGLLWVGTNNGLSQFNQTTETFKNFQHDPNDQNSLNHNEIWSIFEDSMGTLWISTNNGLEIFNRENETFIHYHHNDNEIHSLNNNIITNFYEDSAGILWMSTFNGLLKFDRSSGNFDHYWKGLPKSRINSLLGDEQGCLWLGTTKGLAKFNPKTETFRNYDTMDGLQGDVFFYNSFNKNKNGTLFFGGTGGLNIFHPDQITDNPHVAPVILTNFYIANKPVDIGSDSPLQQHINFAKEIVLNYTDKVFSFEYAALNYTNSKKNQYAYKMEGFNQDWTYTDATRRFAIYTNLDPGHYNFRVKASNNDGLWNKKEASIKITITPPWWQTIWFQGFILVLFIVLVVGGYRWRMYAIKVHNRELEKQVIKRTSELRESQRAMRTLLSNLPGIAYRCRNDRNWTIEFISDACLALTGYPASVFMANEVNFVDIIYIDDYEHIWQLVQQALQNKEPFELTYRIVTKTGQLKWVWEQGQGVLEQHGKFIVIEGLISDITEQKKTEIELQNSEKRLRKMIEKSPLPMVITDANQDIEYFNDKFIELFGYTLQDISTAEQWWKIAYPDEKYRKLVQDSWVEAIEYATAHNIDIEVQIWDLMIKDRTKRHCEFYMVPLDENSLIIMNDITENVKIQTELKKAKIVAETANQAKSTFLARMSHELRTPLNGILGFAQILQRDSSITTKQQHGLHVIEQSGNHLLSLINDVLDLAKVESGKIELCQTDFNLPALLNNISELIELKAKAKGIDFYLEIPDNFPKNVYGDERRLQQVLLNLLGNAIKFTDHGSITLRVKSEKLIVKNTQCLFHFSVHDTGVGISFENQENIFQPFEQVGEQIRQANGTGLGLTISKNLVELMGGQLQVSSQINIGTQFSFELALPIIEHKITNLPVQQLIIGIKDQSPKILVVDDNKENLAVIIDLLTPLGFLVEQANDGCEGLEKAISWLPDVIITDLIMPKMDGFELINQLRQSHDLKNKIIIASSASVYDADRARSLAIGSDSFLPKPIQVEKLFEQLQHHLNLTWLYENKLQKIAEEKTTAPLILPPMVELEKLYKLTLMGDIDELEQHTAILAEDVKLKTFVSLMQDFLKKYKIGQLKKWLEEKIDDK